VFSKRLDSTVLHPIVSASASAQLHVVFIHGLNGDAFKTWRFNETPSWQVWMSDALPEANIWSLGYGLTSSWWSGGSIPLTDRAINVLATLSVELTEELPIVFVCHSYGGLLAKQVLRTSREIAPDYADLTKRVKGIVFFGTPHAGSGVATYSLALRKVLRSSPAIDELRANSALLRELNTWFRRSLAEHPLPISVYYETQPTRGFQVVDEESADPGLAFVIPVAVDADHITLPKPLKPDFRVKQTIGLARGIVSPAAQPQKRNWIAEIMSASDDRLNFIRAELKHALAEHPGDFDALRGQAFLEQIDKGKGGGSVYRGPQERPFAAPRTRYDRLTTFVGGLGLLGLGFTVISRFVPLSQLTLELAHAIINFLN
jgi:pimeloyl-ACP methyl ester carboxylesterase